MKQTPDKEIRSIKGDINLRAIPEGDSRIIEGYALLFNHESNDLGGFTEVIEPEAITQDLINTQDVVALFNHDSNRGILARSTNGAGSLSLTVDEKGLKYSFEAPNTALGDEMVELLKRGDLRESSFAFTCESDKWEKQPDGTYKRHIMAIKALYDVSIVIHPAYNDTKVNCRSYDSMIKRESEELTLYYAALKSNI